ncbi:hypothetical protein FACS1894122_11010 [Alphaproteobacteria bacterium]|nr:hypothetical protein FACS1894122_11010 [Alphaproteobacteria bacterium]
MENNKSTGRPWTDHTTVGGQVLAHRFRMMQQNWRIIGLVGYSSFIIFFLFYLLTHWKAYQIWNYLCCLKAKYRVGMMTLPEHMFNTSFMCDAFGRWKEFADYFIAKTPMLINFKAKFEDSLLLNLELSIAVGIAATVIMLIINKYFGKSISDNKEIISGYDYVDAKVLKKAIKEKSDITLAEIPYPKFSEARHTIITGTTGAGKSNAIIELIDQVKAKGERLIIVDTVGTFVEKYYRDGDIILNPLDPRSVPWSFLSKCNDEILLKNVAACLIGRSDTHDKFWEDAAQIVFVETAKKVIRENKSTREFIDLLLKVSLEEIQSYLKGTYGYSLMDKRADKMAISIRATLINAVSVFDILKESKSDNFSIRNWVIESHAITLADSTSASQTHPAYPSEGGEAESAGAASTAARTMFLSCKPAERTALTPLITAWLSIASEALLQTNPTDKRTWFFIDELHNLKRLPKIETSLAEVRKFGGCFVIGTQMVSQLNAIYGHETAHTITGLCGTKVVINYDLLKQEVC